MLNNEIIEQLSLEEKVKLVNGETFFCMARIERLKIPAMQLLDGGTGINFEQLFGDFISKKENRVEFDNKTDLTQVIDNFYKPEKLNNTEKLLYEELKSILNRCISKNVKSNNTHTEFSPGCFPPGMLLGATWNKNVVYEVGKALGQEARVFGINILLGTPNVNIHRDPLNGRLFEGYSEDPCLVAKLAPELVKGVQSCGVAANVKHFAANNQETNRLKINEIISERALREIYFPGFKACVQDGNVETVMAAYNKINDSACTENEWLLQEVLRDEWGFEGLVISDWGAVYNPVEAFDAGTDLNMPGPVNCEVILQAINDGLISKNTLNLAVKRVLNLINKYGRQEKIELSTESIIVKTKEVAYNAAVEGIVLLKNENNIFPIKKGEKLSLVGSGAEELIVCGGGSAGVVTNRNTNLYEILNEELGFGNLFLNEIPDEVDTILCVISLRGMEGHDRIDMKISTEDSRCLDKLLNLKNMKPNIKLGVILNTCGPVEIIDWLHSIDGIFQVFLPGMEGARALTHLLLGKANPSGKLPLTFPKTYKDSPTFLNFPGDGNQVMYGEGIFVGYRYYDKKEIEPLYPFGYGLSYSNFEISNIRPQSAKEYDEFDTIVFEDELNILVDIENKGPIDGSEVLQLYILDVYSTLKKPIRECKDFEKVFLKKGEKQTILFCINKEKLKSYDTDLKKWTCEEGLYDVYIGNSSRNLPCKIRTYLDVKSEYSYGKNTSIKKLIENNILKDELYKLWKKNNWDFSLIKEKYKYEPSRKVYELIEEANKNRCIEIDNNVSKFYESIREVKII